MVNRKEEIRELMHLSPSDVILRAGDHLKVCNNLEVLYHTFAQDIFNEILENNHQRKPTRIILPIGPIEQYPILVKLIQENDIILEDCWFFFMDEYCDEQGSALKIGHPLSFKRVAKLYLFDPLNGDYGLNLKQIFFPNEFIITKLDNIIKEIGGIDTCYGGIGIQGHLAFNEPCPNIAKLNSRKVELNPFTITINAIRAQVGGNLENFPKKAFTLGMKQILESKRIKLYCRNGTSYDWANTVLRIALFATPGDDYPVTHIRNHSNYVIVTDKDTLEIPKILL
ncbi:MAG: hypothetical protein HWN81_10880 [Candidatus Lokiarchaeota archaeon]|nr:hypothetical protein [Candidatus Lokiarchaeota archaeon]